MVRACARVLLFTAAAHAGLSHTVVAQSTTSLLTDAATLPRGAVRLRATSSWARYDALFGAPGVPSGTLRNLAWALNTDSLGAAQIPLLAGGEAAIRALTGESSFRLSAGQMLAAANSRIVETPLILEYGVASRLTLGVVVPLVQSRTTLEARLNSRGTCPPAKLGTPCPAGVQQASMANVGPNPALTSSAALTNDSALVAQFRAAASALQGQLTQCQADPLQAGCATLLARQGDAQALIQSSNAFASALATLYGSSSQSRGQPFVPLAAGAEQTTINQRVADFNARYRDYFGNDRITGAVVAAGGLAALRQLQALLTDSALARDTIGPTDRTGIGDVSVGATLQIANNFGDTSTAALGRLRYRLAVNGTFRIGTGEAPAPGRLYDVGTGTGQNGVIAGVAADVQGGRWLALTTIGSYTAQLGTVPVGARPAPLGDVIPLLAPWKGTYTAGNVLSLAAVPRLRVTRYFTLDGVYVLQRQAAAAFTPAQGAATASDSALALLTGAAPYTGTTAHQVGAGFSYSTVAAPDRAPGGLPAEVSFRHVETISGSGGPVPKVYQDRIEVKLFYQP